MNKSIRVSDAYADLIDGLRNDKLFFFHKKADVTDSFAAIEEPKKLDSFDKEKIRGCLLTYSRLLDAIAVSKEDQDSIIEQRIICSFKLWHCLTSLKDTIKVLQRTKCYCKDEDKEGLDDVISLLEEFDKDIKTETDKE